MSSSLHCDVEVIRLGSHSVRRISAFVSFVLKLLYQSNRTPHENTKRDVFPFRTRDSGSILTTRPFKENETLFETKNAGANYWGVISCND